MAGTRSTGTRRWSLTDLGKSLRRRDEASGSMVTFIVGTSVFLVSSATLLHFVAEPPGGTGGLEHSDLKLRAARALDILLATPGHPSDWATTTAGVDAVARLGLIERGSSIRVDPAKFEAVANGSTWSPSTSNGAVDYQEARDALGLGGYDFHLRGYPLFEPFADGTYGVVGMESFRVAYIGDWSGSTEHSSSQLERGQLAALPIAFQNTTRTSLLGTGDAFRDSQADLRNLLLPLLGGSPTQTIISNGQGSVKHEFRIVDSSLYASLVPLTPSPSSALALVRAEATTPTASDLNYTRGQEIRAVLGLANMSAAATSATLTWSEFVHTSGDLGDYGYVEVSPDNGTTWYPLTNTALERSTHSALGQMGTRAKSIDATNCAPCLGKNEVWVAFHWLADGDTTTGKGWFIDNVQLTVGASTVFSKTFESASYDLLVIGSNADQNAFTPAEIKHGIRDYVQIHGGRLIVLGGQTNTNWLEPLFHVGIRDATPGVSTPDATHPLLTIPNELDWEGYGHNKKAWEFSAKGADGLFSMVVGSGTNEHILSISSKGAFGDTSADGVVMLTTYLPHTMEGEQALRFFANLLTYGRYHRLYLELGPEVPSGVPVAAATRTATMDKMRVGSDEFVEMVFILYVWQGSTGAIASGSLLTPSAPTSFSVVADEGTATLTWGPPAHQSDTVLWYKVYRGSMAHVETYLATVATTGYIDTTVVNGVTYYYNVTAVNQHGEGDSSAHKSATPTTSPTVPTAVSATGALGSIVLTWSPPSSTGGASIINYRIERSADGSTNWEHVANASASPWSDTSAPAFVTHWYRIHAMNAAEKESPFSTPVSGTSGSAPSQPLLVLATGGAGQVSLTWTASLTGTPTAYTIYRGASAATLTPLATTGSNTSFVDLTTTAPGTTWHYAVSATNSYGEGDLSLSTSATTATVPSAPLTLLASALPGRTASLTWLVPASDGGSEITHYEVWRKAGSGAWTWLKDTSLLTTGDSGLTAGQTYTYRVLAVNAVGDGPDSGTSAIIALL